MKRFTKTALVLSAVIFAAGAGLCVGGLVMGASADDLDMDVTVGHIGLKNGVRVIRNYVRNIRDEETDWDEEAWYQEAWHEEDCDEEWEGGWNDKHHLVSPVEDTGSGRIYQAGLPEKMEIELCLDELILKQYDGNGIRIEVEDDDNDNVRVKVEEEKLSIKSINVQKGRTITLFCPPSLQLKKLELMADAGEVHLEDDLTADKLEINVGAGEFTAEGKITADEAQFEVGAGEFFMERLDTRRLNGECGMGSMDLNLVGSVKDYNCDLECGIVSISLGDDEYSGLARETEIRNGDAPREICLECGIGEIVVSFEE